MLKITLTSGLVGKKETQKRVVAGLGLRKFGSSVVHQDSPTIRGMINKVSHLVEVETVSDGAPQGDKPARKTAARKEAAVK